jgi:hypothetical protein
MSQMHFVQSQLAILMHGRDHIIVVRDGFFIDWTVAKREEARPGKAGTEGFDS